MTISPAPNAVLEIPITVVDGGTLSDADCTYDDMVVFAAGQDRSSFNVYIVDDELVERDVDGDEEYVDFTFDTSGLSDVVIDISGNEYFSLQVTDNDSYEISFSKASGIVDEGIGTVKVAVSIFPLPIEPLSIPISVDSVNRTLSDADCTYDDMVVFAAGQALSSFNVYIVDDAEPEGGEYVDFTFGTLDPLGALVGSEPTCRLVVTDNDGVPSYAVEFSLSSQTVAEDVGTVEVEVFISPAPNDILNIPIEVSASTLTKGADCTYDSMVSFSPGQERSSFVVTIVDDDETEGDEYVEFTFNTLGLPEVVLGTPGTHTLTVMYNDGAVPPARVVSFSLSSQTVAEGVGTVNVEVSIDIAAVAPITIPIVVDTSSTATSADYTLPIPSSVTFVAGETSQNYVVTIVDDSEVESGESVTFIFGSLPPNVTEGSPSTSQITITDNDSPVISSHIVSFAASLSVGEDMGTVNVEVSLDSAAAADITIPIVVDASSTATSADYTLPIPSSVTFAAGETSRNYVVTIVDDIVPESDEFVTFTFGSFPPNVAAGSSSMSTITIVDNDPPVISSHIVSFTNTSLNVGEDIGTVNVEVSIDIAAAAPITIPIVVDTSSTATSADYTLPIPSSVTFPAGETSQNYVVTIVDDSEVESGESVTFTFGSLPPNVTEGSPSMTQIIITDNDPPVISSHIVSFANPSLSVGEDIGTVNVEVSIAPAPSSAVDIRVVVMNTSTADASDYSLSTTVITFPPGTRTASLDVMVRDDTVAEGPETVILGFSTPLPAGVMVSSAQARTTSTITIVDNDTQSHPKYAILVDPVVVSVYPNPVASVLYLVSTGTHDYEASLMTLAGVPVLRRRNSTSLDMSTLAPGVYLLSISFNDTVVVHRIVKE